MTRFLLVLLLISYQATSQSEALRFETPVTITSASKGVFLHLDSSGRRSVAVSGELVGVVWEDNRSGKPAVYIAYQMPGKTGFSEPDKVSMQSPAYEPVIASLPGNRFIVGWEEGKHVWLRVVSPTENGLPVKVGKERAQQISVATNYSESSKPEVSAVWSQGKKRDFFIQFADLSIKSVSINASAPRLVDNSSDKNVQLYPVIENTESGSVVSWEDRRQGATRIFNAYADHGKPFQAYRLLNEFAPSPNPEFGKGSGAMRPVLSGNGKQLIVAAWMDKRNWRSGYDVFAAASANGGREFDSNEQVQDMFGDNVPQWHASVALRAIDNIAVVAWDDTRNETPDIFYSLRINGSWSEDFDFPGATGDGRQSHPSIIFDEKGILHAVWLNNVNGESSLQYSHSLK
ncbi:hypothetical protein [Kaarinaea lacus]